MSTILVTGSSGAIGTALRERLAMTGHDVLGVDRSTPHWEFDIPFERVDLTEPTSLPEADVIIHCAAHSRVPPVVKDPTTAFDNIAMLEPVLESARRHDGSVLFLSSREVYGNSVRPAEDTAGLDAPNPYGGSKLACEALCNSYYKCYDLSVSTIRLSNVYGRYDTNNRVIPIFIALATAGETLTVYGQRKILDFIHVDDVCTALLEAINRPSPLAGETINLGSGCGTSLDSLAKTVAAKIDNCPGYQTEPNRTGEVGKYVADISKVEALLDWKPVISLEDGLDQAVEWYRGHPEILERIRESVQ